MIIKYAILLAVLLVLGTAAIFLARPSSPWQPGRPHRAGTPVS
jgi:hypothetical protein